MEKRKGKIEALDDATWARVIEAREEWRRVILTPGPSDRDATQKVITEMYKRIGKAAPDFYFMPSPLSSFVCLPWLSELYKDKINLRQNLRQNLWQNLEQNLQQNLGQNLWQNLWQNLQQNLGQNLRQNLWQNLEQNLEPLVKENYFGGSCWSAWEAHYDICNRIVGVPYEDNDREVLNLWLAQSRACFWWLPYEKAVVVSDKPHLYWDAAWRLHREDGPAVHFTDGYQLWAWHGVMITEQVILHPDTITSEMIRAEKNAEVRRVLIERMGPGKYLKECKAKLIDMDSLTLEGSAPRALMEDDQGERWLVGTDGSTARVYTMAVPREAKACREAHQMISGFDETRLIAEA